MAKSLIMFGSLGFFLTPTLVKSQNSQSQAVDLDLCMVQGEGLKANHKLYYSLIQCNTMVKLTKNMATRSKPEVIFGRAILALFLQWIIPRFHTLL